MGERIRELRERKAYGQAELARAVGLTPTSLWAIEAGRHAPRPATLRKIAEALGVPVEELTRPDDPD
jgi:transcriptional regulator with XRE-family HTH domain